MRKFPQALACLRIDEAGATLVEYTILLALILVVAVGALTAVGQSTTDTWTQVTAALRDCDPQKGNGDGQCKGKGNGKGQGNDKGNR